MDFLNSFSRTAPANSVAVSSGVWCGGGLGEQRWKREGCGGELLSEFFLRSVFSVFEEGFRWKLNIVHVAGVYWLA